MNTREEFITFLEEHHAFANEEKTCLTSGITRYIKNNPEILKDFQTFTNSDSINISELIYRVVHPEKNNICEVCGAPTEFGAYFSGYKKACGSKCAHVLSLKKGTETKIQKYGIPYIDIEKVKKSNFEKYGTGWYVNVEKRKRTNMERYGTPWANNVEKGKQTCLEKYGVDNVAKLESSKEKKKATTLERYGVKHVMQSPEVVQKYKDNCLAKTGKEWYTQTQETQDLKRERLRKELTSFEENNNCVEKHKILKEYGSSWLKLNLPFIRHKRFLFISNEYLPRIKQCAENSRSNISAEEMRVFEFCKSYLPKEEVLHNYRGLIKSKEGNALELDVYIPSRKVALEFNGLYWHSYSFKDKDYHLYKTQECERQGIRLIHIWEDLWDSKEFAYEDLILRALNIHKEKLKFSDCEIREISKSTYKDFLNWFGLLYKEEASIRLGIFYNGNLLQVAGFSKSRKNPQEYELNCFCKKSGTYDVEDGLLHLTEYSRLNNISLSLDRSLFDYKEYEDAGFKFLSFSEPSFFYRDPYNSPRIRSFEIKKSHLFENDYDKSLSEEDNMLNKGYLKIYDCGKVHLQYSKP